MASVAALVKHLPTKNRGRPAAAARCQATLDCLTPDTAERQLAASDRRAAAVSDIGATAPRRLRTSARLTSMTLSRRAHRRLRASWHRAGPPSCPRRIVFRADGLRHAVIV